MKEKKKSAVSWILTWAGQKRIAYVWSVLLAIGNVIFKILPYFIIADIVKLFLNGEKEFEIYLAKAEDWGRWDMDSRRRSEHRSVITPVFHALYPL